MAKTIKLAYEGKEYTLEFSRESIKQLERQGFVIRDIDIKPMTVLPDLFAGAFIKNHRWVKRDVIDKIFDTMRKKDELLGKLADMYNEPLEAMMTDPEGSEGNSNWETSW